MAGEMSAKEVKELDEMLRYEQCLEFRAFIEKTFHVTSIFQRGEFPDIRTTVKTSENITISYTGNWYTIEEAREMDREHLEEIPDDLHLDNFETKEVKKDEDSNSKRT